MKKILLFSILYFLSSYPLSYGAEVLQEIIVKEGDTLWGVANYYLKDSKKWPEILRYNPQLSSDPNIILPGMRIKVPILLIKEHLRAAYLIYILQDVRYRRKNETEWKKSWLNMELYEEDGVRTFDKSQANIKFPSGEILQLYENSLLIVRPEKPKEEVELVAGQVRASKAKILTADTVVNPRIVSVTDSPDFKTKIKEDKTTLVEVYKGIIDVTAQGKTVTVREGFGTEVKFKQPPTPPVKLPEMPEFHIVSKETPIVAARDSKIELTRIAPEAEPGRPVSVGTPSKKEAKHHEIKIIGSAVKKYRVQISTSSAFKTIVYDHTKKLEGRIVLDFKEIGLADGLYFWRMSYLDELGFEGPFSTPKSFIIDTKPPEIRLVSPKDGEEIITDFIYVEGYSEPGATLFVNNVPCDIEENGKFLYALLSKEGPVTIKVKATDSAGNTNTVERNVIKVKKGQTKTSDKAARKTQRPGIFPVIILVISVVAGLLVLLVKP